MDIMSVFERMAENGHAPKEGCHLFTVGHGDAIGRLRAQYIRDSFARGRSSEKLIIGPFGSGKTHFMRHFMELARQDDCVTCEVALNRDQAIDFSQPHLVYRQIVEELNVPGETERGLVALFRGAAERIRRKARDAGAPEGETLLAWIAALDSGFRLQWFGRVMKIALDAMLRDDVEMLDQCTRWLGGDMLDRGLARTLRVPQYSANEAQRIGRLAFLSLLQFIKRAKFTGTVVGFDEAEQSFDVNRARLLRIHSVLQSFINALADLDDGSALMLFALTPTAVERMGDFPALQQRIADPGPGLQFFDGNVYATKIDLTSAPSADFEQQLREMGERFVDVFVENIPESLPDTKVAGYAEAARAASEVTKEMATSGARREVAKRISSWLLVRHGRHLQRASVEPEF